MIVLAARVIPRGFYEVDVKMRSVYKPVDRSIKTQTENKIGWQIDSIVDMIVYHGVKRQIEEACLMIDFQIEIFHQIERAQNENLGND
jgi:hypothetical protein